MHMPKNGGGGSYTPAPAGTHIATCIKVLDLGTQRVEWQGDVKHQRKIMIQWELAGEALDDGRPITHSQRYTLSSSDKSTLRKHLEGWRGKKFSDEELGPGGFNIKNVLGKSCSLIVSHSIKGDRVYANTDGIGPVPKSVKAPEPVNELVYLSLEPSLFDRQAYDGLSDNLKTVIAASPEFELVTLDLRGSSGNGADEEIPF